MEMVQNAVMQGCVEMHSYGGAHVDVSNFAIWQYRITPRLAPQRQLTINQSVK